MVKPPFTYFGGKARIAPKIAALFPPHRHYVEPFAGSLSVLLAKEPSRIETVNDLDGDLMTFWRVLRERPDELARAAALTPHSRAEHQAAYDLTIEDDLERARRVWVLLSQGRSAHMRRTGWRFGTGQSGSLPQYLEAYADRMPPAASRLAGVSLECRDALDVIRDYGDRADTLIYADPPYPGSLRTWGNVYRHEMRDDSQHRDLAEALHSVQATVLLSGYASTLYDDNIYADWHRTEIAANAGNGAPGTQRRTEVIWSNKPLTVTVEDAFDFDPPATRIVTRPRGAKV